MEPKKWDNEERRRYYGVRVGDRVSYDYVGSVYKTITGVVVEYGFMDNNAVYVRWDHGGEPSKFCPEWLTITQRVEDIKKAPEYIYLGDRFTVSQLKGKPCSAVRQNGKCIRGRNGSMLVKFEGRPVVVIARLLRKIK
jgi:hypothetical protein